MVDPLAACLERNESGGPFYYHNPLENGKERVVCGTIIPANQTRAFNELCHERGRLFATLPDTRGTGMPPVTARLTYAKGEPKAFEDCDIPCHEVSERTFINIRLIEGTDWAITMSMEGAKIYDRPEMDRYAWRRHKSYSTTSFQSEIPLPYSSSEEYKIWDAAPVDYDTAIFGVVFVARNCVRSNDRERLVVHLRRLAKSRRCCNRQGSYKQHKQQPRQTQATTKAIPPPLLGTTIMATSKSSRSPIVSTMPTCHPG